MNLERMTSTSESIHVLAFTDDATRKVMYLGTRQVPKIDGSQGAFIAVVVVLSVLIVVCCAAVFYLLRYHEPTDQERSARRERYRRSQEQTLHSSSSFSGPTPSTTFGSGSLGDKVRQMWQSTTSRGRGGGGRGGGRGWIRAGSDGEWVPHRADDESGGNSGTGHPDPELGNRLRLFPALRQDALRNGGGGSGAAVEGVRVSESPSSDAGSVRFAPGYTYVDPFSKTTSADVALQRSQSPLSSPASSPRESTSVDKSPHPSGDDRRHRLTMSSGSVWTHAGSKFVEDI